MALLESDAAVRRAAHQRLRDALRQLTGTRSFHNFCPHFHDSSDGKSVRSVYRCRSVRETQTPFFGAFVSTKSWVFTQTGSGQA
jgi:tRNA U38,U39,U40 pseudouridine synthase TruA